MMEIKVPFYNILNMFLTGLLFIGSVLVIFYNNILPLIKQELVEGIRMVPESISVICFLGVIYAIGLIMNRVGSIFIEPIFKKIGWIPFEDDYILFNKKRKKYPVLNTLSREYALSRSSFTVFFIFLPLSIFFGEWGIGFALAMITIVCVLSWRKYAERIVALMREDGDDI